MKLFLLFLACVFVHPSAAFAEDRSAQAPAQMQTELEDLETRHEAEKYKAYLDSIKPKAETVPPGMAPELAAQRQFEKALKDTEKDAERERRRILRRWQGKESVRAWFDEHPGLSRWIRSAF